MAAPPLISFDVITLYIALSTQASRRNIHGGPGSRYARQQQPMAFMREWLEFHRFLLTLITA